MSKADELLNSLASNDVSVFTANPEVEPHIVIGSDRFVSVPEELRRIAVQHDHNIETVTFDCPRYWDGYDFNELKIYVHYMRADGKLGQTLAKNVVPDTDNLDIVHFDWVITNNLSHVHGAITFLVCVKTTDLNGKDIVHWNSELNNEMYVSEGMEPEDEITESNPDIITQLLVRMDEVEECVEATDIISAVKYYNETKEFVEDAKTEHNELSDRINTECERIDQLIGGYNPSNKSAKNVHKVTFSLSAVMSSGFNRRVSVMVGNNFDNENNGVYFPTGRFGLRILAIEGHTSEAAVDLKFNKTSSRHYAIDSPSDQPYYLTTASIEQLVENPYVLGTFDYDSWGFEIEVTANSDADDFYEYEGDLSVYFTIIDAEGIECDGEIYMVGGYYYSSKDGLFVRRDVSGIADYNYIVDYKNDNSTALEVQDLRVDAYGKIHDCAGSAVRSQIRGLEDKIQNLNGSGGSGSTPTHIEISQTTGDSTTAVMSQKAVTDAINSIVDDIPELIGEVSRAEFEELKARVTVVEKLLAGLDDALATI